MSSPLVHWFEGMFLRPHHLQAAQRNWMDLSQTNAKWNVHHNWGLRSLELDLDALANYRFVVRSLKARLPDSTDQVVVLTEGMLPALDLKPAFATQSSVTVFLGLPLFNLGKPNASAEATSETARYLVETSEFEDENTGVNSKSIQFRKLNAKLLLSSQTLTGYAVLPIARVEKSFAAAGTLQLDETYIPPLLACDAWPPLRAVLQGLSDRFGKKLEVLSSQVLSRSVSLDSRGQGDAELFLQLSALNEAVALLGVVAFSPGVHPFAAYLELCRLVGRLAIFGQSRRTPALPRYDHDDLGGCFYHLKRLLDGYLDSFVEPAYKEVPFVGVGTRMQVSLQPAWVESHWLLLVGVRSPLTVDACIDLLTRPGQHDVKLGCSDRIETIFRLGLAGLKLSHCSRPPLALPVAPDLIYFQLDLDSQRDEWYVVQRSLTLALRFSENLTAGSIQGEKVLKLKQPGGAVVSMTFTLFALADGKR